MKIIVLIFSKITASKLDSKGKSSSSYCKSGHAVPLLEAF
jgi:hypothetical protein